MILVSHHRPPKTGKMAHYINISCMPDMPDMMNILYTRLSRCSVLPYSQCSVSMFLFLSLGCKMFRSMDSNQAHSLSPQVPGVKQIPFFSPTGQRMIQRHPLNDRRQDQVLQEYIRSVESKGIVRGVRGDAWVCAACDPKDPARGDSTYWALTFATLTLASNLFTQKVPQDMQHAVLHEYSIHGWKYIDTCWICKHNPQSVAKLKLESLILLRWLDP